MYFFFWSFKIHTHMHPTHAHTKFLIGVTLYFLFVTLFSQLPYRVTQYNNLSWDQNHHPKSLYLLINKCVDSTVNWHNFYMNSFQYFVSVAPKSCSKNAALMKDWIHICCEVWDFDELLCDLRMSHDLQKNIKM